MTEARWYRLSDPDVGEFSRWSDDGVFPDGLKVLDKDAVDRHGVPLPAKPKRNLTAITNPAGKPVDQMTKEELVEHAARTGVDVDLTANKPDLLAAIAAHEGAPTS